MPLNHCYKTRFSIQFGIFALVYCFVVVVVVINYINIINYFRPQKHVWHGALPNGERSIDTYCDAWHTGARDKSGYASNLLGNKLLDQDRQTCDSKLIVLCVEALSQDRRKKRDLKSER